MAAPFDKTDSNVVVVIGTGAGGGRNWCSRSVTSCADRVAGARPSANAAAATVFIRLRRFIGFLPETGRFFRPLRVFSVTLARIANDYAA